jgi:hypothetical protein
MNENVETTHLLNPNEESIILFGIPLEVMDVSPSSPVSSYGDAMDEYKKTMETIYSKYNFMNMENEGSETEEGEKSDSVTTNNDEPPVHVSTSDDLIDYSDVALFEDYDNDPTISNNESKLVTFDYNACQHVSSVIPGEHVDVDDIALKAIIMEEEYAIAYTQPMLQHIAGYYGLKRATSKKIIIQNIVEFELNPDNATKVSERHRMFNYFNELKKDPYMSTHMIVPI